jgi:1,4-alpha-glucan branching enzyme
MLKKKAVKGTDEIMSVTFETTVPEGTESVYLVGDFNDWNADKTQMKKRKDGMWAVTLRLPTQKRYQYRFVVDGDWITDADAELVVPNPFGTKNAVCVLN